MWLSWWLKFQNRVRDKECCRLGRQNSGEGEEREEYGSKTEEATGVFCSVIRRALMPGPPLGMCLVST